MIQSLTDTECRYPDRLRAVPVRSNRAALKVGARMATGRPPGITLSIRRNESVECAPVAGVDEARPKERVDPVSLAMQCRELDAA
jgi:hypothetical protein